MSAGQGFAPSVTDVRDRKLNRARSTPPIVAARAVPAAASHDAPASASEGSSSEHAWPVRDHVLTFHDVPLESGDRLDRLDVRYRLEGELAPARDNLVLIVHALTGTVDATTWWRGVVDRGGAIDPTRHAVLTANLLGGCNGTTGPTNANPDALPPFTTRDQAAVLARVLDALGVRAPLLVCGGSLGGQVTLEFAASFPDRVRAAVVLAAPAAQTAQGLAWNTIMRRAVTLGGVTEGLALARMIGMLSYRTPEALERRFGRARSANGTFLVNDWLDVHGERLVARFDASSYGALIDAMDAHDVGRGRGGIAAALAPVADRLTGVGIPGDLLYPAECVREWAQAARAHYVDLPSVHGHDAFLLETARVSAILRSAIGRATDASDVHDAAGNTAQPTTPSAARSASQSRSTTATKSLRVALAGCGHVGGNLLELFGSQSEHGADIQVTRVLVRDASRPRPSLARAIAEGIAPGNACITDSTALLEDDVDVLVEAIGGTTTARTLVEQALKRRIRVVTANKALLAERGPYLQRLARTYGTRIDFEGAVAGAIPVVRCVRSGAAGVGISKISGILNGTSNFVLDRVAEGASLADAVAIAQRLGYAEADPTRDLSGEDAEDKLRVLAWLTFGIDPATLSVVRRGIDAETAAWAAHVAGEGDRVKLIASCAREEGELVARILPTRVTRDDAWASVTGPNNRIVIESDSAGSLVFHGAGAGGRATAGAVLSDVLS
jgi:homoserine O-acetyltransferase